MKRRTFIKQSGMVIGGTLLASPLLRAQNQSTVDLKSMRPAEGKRCFSSKEVEKLINKVKSSMADNELAWLFENCFPNTLDTTVDFEYIDGQPDTFVITGDIDAMWLRDSTAQVWPYMPLIKKDKDLREVIKGLVKRQTKCIILDPYANAFYKDVTKVSKWQSDRTQMLPGIHERKWEIDSLCYAVRLANEYYSITGDSSVFDDDWQEASRLIVQTFKAEQRKDGTTPYTFNRETGQMFDSPVHWGLGRPVKPVGLICSMFRPSDDATLYPYLIPSNVFAVVSLRQMANIHESITGETQLAKECTALADEVDAAIRQYAIVEHLDFGEIYAYEVDGFGNRVFMDDANVPSLMSLAYLGAHQPDDALYKRTRAFLLSDNNPYYLTGKAAEGQASPHTGQVNIWPMGIILRAMTSTDDKEILHCLKMLKATHAGTGFMHESFHKDDASKYTRDWFAWANTLFGELIVKLYHERPHLLKTEL
ncbi:glycoside hydrolase family 125 protein [Carboxylicivirga sediminis]|uniref:Glycoside hydrolase family 125 protein n=1 Tax=Carboxylicivirga sediminis TaxID=2006564 RepID=A0A941F2N6_9BACT|nr:glycoside hydrolase family 125 protein [Carboxylicivirga sediminis]MBR8535013.1 glycoside hydrolase family 125 protein [Carboxylicivirga sediminis]